MLVGPNRPGAALSRSGKSRAAAVNATKICRMARSAALHTTAYLMMLPAMQPRYQ